MKIKNLNQHHKQHHDQSDCGVVCLTSILSYYNSYQPLEELRELSGTNKTVVRKCKKPTHKWHIWFFPTHEPTLQKPKSCFCQRSN